MDQVTAEHDDADGESSRKRNCDPGCSDTSACDVCDLLGYCDFGLFSSALIVGSVLAGLAARPGRARPRATVADRAGRAAIVGYRRWLSHRLPTRCRYTPTCSAYGLAVVERHGLAVGGRMAAARVRRCRPEVPLGTVDPVE